MYTIYTIYIYIYIYIYSKTRAAPKSSPLGAVSETLQYGLPLAPSKPCIPPSPVLASPKTPMMPYRPPCTSQCLPRR